MTNPIFHAEPWMIITYFTINCIISMIWLVIPVIINAKRQEYELPAAMVIWPMRPKFFRNSWLGLAIRCFISGTLIVLPAMFIYIIGHTIYLTINWVANSLAFTKEDKVQIAIGTLQKKDTK